MARSSSIGGIFAELTLRDTKFAAGMKSAGAKLKALGAASVKYGAMAGAALSAGLGAGVKRTIDLGGELTDLSAQTGVAIDDLMVIQQAYKDNGKEAAAAAKDINKMQKSIVAASKAPGSATDPFAKIGLSAEKLLRMNPKDQFFAISKAIKEIQNPTEKAAAAMEIFGKSGGSLLAVFDGADLESINQSLGKMPEIMREFAGELDHAGDLLGRLPNKSDQFFTGFTAGIAEHIIPGLETIDGFDFTGIGKSLGDALGSAIKHASFLMNVFYDTAREHFSLSNLGDPTAMFDIPGNLAKNIDKYSQAFNEIEKEYNDRAEERRKKASDEKAYEDARNQEYRDAPDYVDPYKAAREFEHRTAPDYVDPAKNLAEKAAKMSKPREFKAPEFDEYQRRGLSLSASPQANMEKKTLNVMEQVRDILARMERAPQTATF